MTTNSEKKQSKKTPILIGLAILIIVASLILYLTRGKEVKDADEVTMLDRLEELFAENSLDEVDDEDLLERLLEQRTLMLDATKSYQTEIYDKINKLSTYKISDKEYKLSEQRKEQSQLFAEIYPTFETTEDAIQFISTYQNVSVLGNLLDYGVTNIYDEEELKKEQKKYLTTVYDYVDPTKEDTLESVFLLHKLLTDLYVDDFKVHAEDVEHLKESMGTVRETYLVYTPTVQEIEDGVDSKKLALQLEEDLKRATENINTNDSSEIIHAVYEHEATKGKVFEQHSDLPLEVYEKEDGAISLLLHPLLAMNEQEEVTEVNENVHIVGDDYRYRIVFKVHTKELDDFYFEQILNKSIEDEKLQNIYDILLTTEEKYPNQFNLSKEAKKILKAEQQFWDKEYAKQQERVIQKEEPNTEAVEE